MGDGGWIGRESVVLALFINLSEAIFVKRNSWKS